MRRAATAIVPLAAIPLLLCLAPGSPAAEPDHVAMRIEVFGIAGLHVLTNRITVDEAPGRYRIVSDIATRGMAGVFVDLKSHSVVQGRVVAGHPYPSSFHNDRVRDHEPHHDSVEYGANGAITGRADPPVPASAGPVTPAQMQGTVDQLTAYFLVEQQLAGGGSCTKAIPVFDGRHRYDLYFTDAGEQTLQADSSRGYRGPTHVCRVMRREVAGFKDGADTDEGIRSGRIWFARLMRGDLLVPVRMQFSSELGEVTGDLAELHGRGVNLAFRE